LQVEVKENVEAGSELHTDTLKSYSGLDAEYVHNVVDDAETYVRGHVRTNGLENFWSLLKRGIKGTYVSVEPYHLFRYLDEQAFRFNERDGKDADRFARTGCGASAYLFGAYRQDGCRVKRQLSTETTVLLGRLAC
jgi:hypothetical protein